MKESETSRERDEERQTGRQTDRQTGGRTDRERQSKNIIGGYGYI